MSINTQLRNNWDKTPKEIRNEFFVAEPFCCVWSLRNKTFPKPDRQSHFKPRNRAKVRAAGGQKAIYHSDEDIGRHGRG